MKRTESQTPKDEESLIDKDEESYTEKYSENPNKKIHITTKPQKPNEYKTNLTLSKPKDKKKHTHTDKENTFETLKVKEEIFVLEEDQTEPGNRKFEGPTEII